MSESPDLLWGTVDYKDKVVLDIGSDNGSTVFYFKGKGAKQVIALDSNQSIVEDNSMYSATHHFGESVIPVLLDAKSVDIEYFITFYKVNVVKLASKDIEPRLLDVKDEVFSTVDEYQVQVNSDAVYKLLLQKFEHNNYDVIDINAWGGIVKIISAKKRIVVQ